MAIYTLVGENSSSSNAPCIKQYDSDTGTWSTIMDVGNAPANTGGLYSVHGTPDGQFLMAGGYKKPGFGPIVIKSSDGGATWSYAGGGVLESIPGTAAAYNLQVVSSTEAYCCVRNVIYKWNGSTWSSWIDTNASGTQLGIPGTQEFVPGKLQVIGDYLYITFYGGGSFALPMYPVHRILRSVVTPARADIENETSINIYGTTKGISDISIDSDGVLYAVEHDRYNNWTREQVWRGTWNNFVIDYSGTEGVNDRYPLNECFWGNYAQPGYRRLYISPNNTVFWLFNNGNNGRRHWVGKRDPVSGDWASVMLIDSDSYMSSSIIGSADDDIMSIAGMRYWWDSGPGWYQHYDGVSWNLTQDSGYSIPGGTVLGMFDMFVPSGADENPPYVQNLNPVDGETGVAHDVDIYFEIVDNEENISLPNTIITIESETAYNGSSFVAPYNGPLSVVSAVEGVPSGYSFLFDRTSNYDSLQTVNVNIESSDLQGNIVSSGYSFQIEFYDTGYGYLGHQANVDIPDHDLRHQFNVVAGPTQIAELESNFAWNQFDEFALLAGLKRLPEETNSILKRRTLNTFVDLANSTYRGLINGITRELGLSLYYPIIINPKKSPFTGKFYARDPYIKIDESYIYLYSDYENDELECEIDRCEKGGNYEHLLRLVNFINSTSYFEASINGSYDPYIRSMVIINQTNRKQVQAEDINSTKTKLQHNNLVKYNVMFNKHDAFKVEKSNLLDISRNGDYYIDYEKGIVTTYTQPTAGTAIRYQYIDYPFKPVASDVIIHDINKDSFKVKMFKQILQDDGTYANGLLTELGADIVNELMSVTPMYFGV